MRAALLSLALLLPVVPGPARAELSKVQCAKLANSVSTAATATGSFARTMDKVPTKELTSGEAAGVIVAAAKAEEARRAALEPLKKYAEALEDLTHQLRLCAR